ncbi:unnamed protein product [Phytophthora fragariaefolia]|uniref:Unnamed protein product n=1 Tax=Phytophthora fragariaefolia TaxID=1490495 RepID=A0A9W7D9H6_9STRA|nr:unnamed protein product [Phytophthora fragariaefolia]
MTVPTKTVQLTVYMQDFQPYTNDFLVIDVPEGQNLLLGMPWLKATNPDIDWVNERVQPRARENSTALEIPFGKKTKTKTRAVKTPHKPSWPAELLGGQSHPVSPQKKKKDENNYFKHGFLSTKSGNTNGKSKKVANIEEYCGSPVHPVLVKHKDVFQQKLPSRLPPLEHGEHGMQVDTKEAVFRKQWRQSPEQEEIIMDWTREMQKAGLIRLSKSPHGAPTFCVKKPAG